MIIEQIKKDNLQAMKDKNATARTIYGIVMNKHLLLSVERRKDGKETTDEDMIAILQKTIKELTEEKETFKSAGREDTVKELETQIEIISKYLPKMLSEDEIKTEIEKLEDKSIPSIMKYFKANYNGKVDMSVVNKIAKQFN